MGVTVCQVVVMFLHGGLAGALNDSITDHSRIAEWLASDEKSSAFGRRATPIPWYIVLD